METQMPIPAAHKCKKQESKIVTKRLLRNFMKNQQPTGQLK